MKKPRLYLVPVAIAALALTGCQSGGDAASTDAAAPDAGTTAPATAESAALDDGVLQACYTGDYRPFSYDDPDTDERTGIDVALMEDLADDLGVELEWVKTSWSDLMSTFLSSCDIAVGGISVTDERAEQVAFSDPVIVGGKAAITMCGREDEFDELEEVNQPDTTLITPVGGTNEAFADENAPEADIVRYDDNNTIFDQIVAGDADVMITDAPEVVWAAHEHPELCEVNADEPFTDATLAYMLPLDDAEFAATVNAWLASTYEDGTWDAAVSDWFGDDSVFSAEQLQEALD
ncbi:transporter substrate-binding domain-containing protein [Gulosibacter sediminis]|uniref:transporter substrate-binding domain-containing protein n=1 Tax=Gulosibacter sediminis TaxID=1729695 RepID=UPI001866AA37|nr:transporter substrate-binding domain-containing protein [Gulosibacter sediminis]